MIQLRKNDLMLGGNGKERTTAADRGNRVRTGSVFPERYKSDKIGSIRIFSV